MLEDWIKIGKRRRKLIDKLIALDSRRSLEQLSKWTVSNLERELFLFEHCPNYIPTIYIQDNNKYLSVKNDERITRLINHAKANNIWDECPKKGKWV
ncbi:hypothetical protein LCGC14_1215280 [marine sediment metagenome]|uniref:Uncharacterized protein n=1 Tax=marine sediment metagenome TaxID=412755 RepID=A0A0F9M0A4_9ZZZZ